MKQFIINRNWSHLKIAMNYMLFSFLLLSGFKASAQATKWVAPANACALKNPLKGNMVTLADSKKLYQSVCAPCHGAKGRGDGPAAIALNPKPADHSSAAIQSECDGSLFWKLSEGRGAMASYKKTLTADQRWGLINYIRTLKKG